MTVTNIDDARSRGRRPPHDLQAEESLLGAMLLSKDAIDSAAERLGTDDFYKPGNAHIFDAITTLAAAGEPADTVTVASALQGAGVLDHIGGGATLVRLVADVPAISNAARYARSIADCAALRRLISTAGELAELGYEGRGDVRATLDRAETLVFELAQRRTTDTSAALSDILDTALSHLEDAFERGEPLAGLATGFVDLDELLSGLRPGALYVLGARPSMGKTSLALNILAHAALREKTPTLLFTLEMSQLEIANRLLSAEGQIDSKRLRHNQITDNDWARIAQAVGPLADATVEIDDNPSLTINELRAKARRYKSKHGDLGLVVVDYVQLMTGRSSAENRQVELAEISRGLKVLARELNVPVLALSQLSRSLEARGDKRPQLSDLRETGALEQDSDVVMFIYRDEVYDTSSPDRGTAEVIVAKHRNGPVGVVRLAFQGPYTRFVNMAKGGRG